MATLQPTNALEIISDVVCPWCYIGKRRLSHALDLLGGEIPLTVHWRPYELNPAMPLEGRERGAHYARKFGSLEDAANLIANITSNAHNDGLAMDYEKIKRVPNTLTAHRLIWFAERFDAQNAIVDALFEAYFVEGHDVGDRDVLIDIAERCKLERNDVTNFLDSSEAVASVTAEMSAARDAGIHGVPAFVLNGQFLFSGAQSPETIALSIKRAIARAARA
ncbi:MAG: putative DsbA family dithiol-disulfide isomerase [Gammaproteobacteria bacterium]|jgi:predicted DsbA family dithiol-disulfide isomerase